MSMIICEKDLCCGCALCADVCPCGAIEIAPDEYGFARPVVNGDKCVGCGACRDSCPVNLSSATETLSVFAAYAKDTGIRIRSSSGGIFRLLADKIISEGGAVAAVGYDEKYRAVYKIAEKSEELGELMGSKYTEARSDGIYAKVKRLLDEGRRVMFVGTPCRAAALKSLVGENEDLLTVDFICHGVPTPVLLEKFLSENFGNDIKHVYFRDKTHGWQEFSMRVDTEERKPYIKSQYKDPYLRVFLGNAALRESCYDCRFKGDRYASDITLGDFWGISSCIPSMNDDRGTSVVIIRTDRGEKMFDGISDALVYKKSTLEDAERTNVSLNVSAKMPASRDKLIEMIERDEAYETIASNFGRPASAKVIISERVKRRVKKVLGKIKR